MVVELYGPCWCSGSLMARWFGGPLATPEQVSIFKKLESLLGLVLRGKVISKAELPTPRTT